MQTEQAGGATIDISVSVNGEQVTAQVPARTLLVDFLRDYTFQSGVRIGCEEGACGACTVQLDGDSVKSCLVLAASANGSEITTVSGLAQGRQLSRLQQAFIESHALQCGYCTAGMLMSAHAFLQKQGNDDFDDDDIRQALGGNLCRCTGYNNIIHAVKVAAGKAEPFVRLDDSNEDGNNWIGRPTARREDRRLVAGRGRYTDTIGDTNDLHACAARSQRAHAKIISIDTTLAKKMPGVRSVITGEEAKAHWQPISPAVDLLDLKLPQRFPLATDKVIFYGEPIALIVADSAAEAEDAARAVNVEYEDLPVNISSEDSAAATDDALIYPEWETNVQVEYGFEHGEVDRVFAEADLVIDESIDSHRFGAMPMETRVVHARYDADDDRLTVHSSTQVPHQARLYLAQVFGIPETRIQVIAQDVGGGFGSKLTIDAEYLPALGAILTGRPVRFFESRSEWIHAGFAARDYRARSRAAFARDGSLLAMDTQILADMGCDGAERASGIGMPLNGGNYAPGPYQCDIYRTKVQCVVTNKAPYNAYRGYGKDLANMLIERVLDQAADQLEIDPVRIRKQNLLTAYPHQIITGPIIENGSIAESLDRLVEIMDVPSLREQQASALTRGRYLGICLVPYIEPAGATFPGSAFQNYESVNLRLAADGSVHVMTGIQSIGQGIETVYAQVAADILGCAFSDVSVSWGDTTATPWGSGTFSSRGAMFAVGAMLDAAEKLKQRIHIGASVLLECDPEQVSARHGTISNSKNDKTCSFAELAYAAYVQPGAEILLDAADAPILEAQGTYRHPQVNWKPDEMGRAQFYPAHANGAEGALVEVDPDTGRVEVLKIWMVADHGIVLNPLLMKGQIQGGLVQHIGGTIYENLQYDDQGIPQQSTLKEYGMPTIWAAPEIEIEHMETKSPCTSVGAKGGGEDGCIATSTVLMGAVEDALRPFGVKVMSGPLSPARVRAWVEAADATSLNNR